MIQFYITETGTYNQLQLVDPSQAFVIDVLNKRMKLMENDDYVLEFQKLSDAYKTTISSSDLTGLSLKGAYDMYVDLHNQIIEAAGVTPLAVSEQISSSLGPVNASITTINSSVNTIETKLSGIEEGAQVNVNADWDAQSGDASILNRPTLGALAALDSLSATDVGAIPNASFGVAGGVATLDSEGRVPSSQLPSYVDDIIEGYLYEGAFYEDEEHQHEITGEGGKIYVDKSTNTSWRWAGSSYTQVSESLALGETAGTAYEGSKGKQLYDDLVAHESSANIHVSAADRTAWDAASTASHTHTNKDVIDGITSDDITAWNDASNAKHSHSNKAVLDGITDSSFHEHANKSVLDGITSDDVTAWTDASNAKHSHANKSVIDGITSDDITAWNDASNAKHTHANADILNGLTDTSISDFLRDTSYGSGTLAELSEGTSETDKVWNASTLKNYVTGLGYTTNTGTVTSVALSVPTGLSVSGSPITESGTLEVTMADGYAIPLNASLDDFQEAYVDKHTHSNKNVIDSITSSDVTNWIDASNAKHTHSNANILDGITDTSIADFLRDTSYGAGTVQDLTTGTDTTVKVWSASVINQYLAEVDANAVRYKGDFNAGTGEITSETSQTLTSVSNKKGDLYIVSTAGTFLGVEMQVGDSIIFKKNVAKNVAPEVTDISFVLGTVKVVNQDASLEWNTLVKIATVEGVDISVALPVNPTAGYGNVVTKDYTDSITNDGSLNVVTGKAVKDYVDGSLALAHSHSNIGILDGITDTSVSNWNDAYSWGDHSQAGYAQQSYVLDVSSRLATTNSNVANVSTYASNVSTYAVNVSTRLATTNTNVANVSTYVQNVSTYAANVSTRLDTTNTNLNNVSTYASNVSTYAANVSTHLNTTNTNVANVSSYAADVSTRVANVSTDLAELKSDVSVNEFAWAAAWNQLFALNPQLVRPATPVNI